MLRFIALLTAALALGGCASFNQLSNEVSTYGPWPADRKPATYAFERLPSQEAQLDKQRQQQLLEQAATGALQQAGFSPAVDPRDADVLVQLGARVMSDDPWIYNDPLFLRGGFYGGWGGYYGAGWGGYGRWGRGGFGWQGAYPYDLSIRYQREVALVLRDRRTGQLLYEARANNSGPSPSVDYLLPAMFDAAMKNFPAVGPNPRPVTVELQKKQQG